MVSRPAGRVTVRDIAAQTGVSIATVSRVLNGQVHVAPETRELVQQAAERLRARGPGSRTGSARVAQDAVYVRCPYILTDYFGLIVSSVAETLALHGRAVVLDAGTAEKAAAILPSLPSRPGIAGAIAILPPEPSEQLAALSPGIPLRRGRSAHPATSRYRRGLGRALRRSAQRNRAPGPTRPPAHRHSGRAARLARRPGPPDRHTSALAEAGVLHPSRLTRAGEPTVRFGHRAAGELLDLPQRPTALACFNDKTAVGALAAASERGLRVPEDLSITGFDDIDLAQATSPMLTTVRQPLAEMGRIAVSLLIRLLDGHQVDALHVELATDLIVRGSTGPA